MCDSLITSIKSYATLSESEVNEFVSKTDIVYFEKGELLLEVGEVCRDWAFIVKGSFREYFVDENIDEVTTNLFVENTWVLNHQSFTGQKPSMCKIEAFEKSEIRKINIHDIHDLIGTSPAYFGLGRILEIESERLQSQASPEQKYLDLIENKPEVLQTFPLKHIASFLGMTPETLSRVRARI